MGRSQDLPRTGPGGEFADDTGCFMLHVDMDAFFVSVERRDNPALHGKPVIVAGLGTRGVVASASYEARAFGVRSAMPTSHARRLCPHGTFVSPRHGVYGPASCEVMEILRSVTPLVEPLSLDEAFLDVSGSIRLLGSPVRIAELVRARVRDELGLTCSVGVAPVKFVAKLASTRCKPDGLLVVPRDGVLDFLHPLPVHALWGVGASTRARLERLGLGTVGALARYPPRALKNAVGVAAGTHLYELARGRDPRRVTPETSDKSIGAEQTFEADLVDHAAMRKVLLSLAGTVARRMHRAGHAGRTISLKLRFADFTTLTRSRSLSSPTQLARDLYATSLVLLEGLALDRPRVRLLGIRAEGLVPAGEAAVQLALGEPERGWREAEEAIALLSGKFGDAIVQPATLVRPAGPTAANQRSTADRSGEVGDRPRGTSTGRPLRGAGDEFDETKR